ncbi:MAG: AlkA N-terminal domain-containing protein, partial [Acidimicrobiales bacterium]
MASVTVRLPFRPPLDSRHLVAWLKARTITGLQQVEEGAIVRTLRLANGPGMVRLRFGTDSVSCDFRLSDQVDLATAEKRCRRLLDLDADP